MSVFTFDAGLHNVVKIMPSKHGNVQQPPILHHLRRHWPK